MAELKCKMCAAPLNYDGSTSIAECEYCGLKQTIPTIDDEKKLSLYDRANLYRSRQEFDRAAGVYEGIVADAPNEAEAHWGLCLCRYGIEYVKDPRSDKKIPTCHRTQFKSILEDEDYLAALENADVLSREVYEEEARYIDAVQKKILAISSKEEPFDIFICYKETDEKGDRTLDSVEGQNVYDALTEKGYKVFFSRITLEDKLGTEYEPYIFAALNSAPIMIVMGTETAYFNAVWVKNEWNRYLALIEQGKKKTLIPCHKLESAYDMPDEFSSLQAVDMNKLGWMQDLVRGVEKILPKKSAPEPAPSPAASGAAAGVATVQSQLTRAFMFLEDGKWEDANTYCERVLDIDPQNAQAYIGKLMVDLNVRRKEGLKNQKTPFDKNDNYRKAYRFGDTTVHELLDGAIKAINERNELAEKEEVYSKALKSIAEVEHAMDTKEAHAIINPSRAALKQLDEITGFKDVDNLKNNIKDSLYECALRMMDKANNGKEYKEAVKVFLAIPDYVNFRDSEKKAEECSVLAEKSDAEAAEARKQFKYNSALENENDGTKDSLQKAIEQYGELGDYKDSEDRVKFCIEKRSAIIKAEDAAKEKARKSAKRKHVVKKIFKTLLTLAIIGGILYGIYVAFSHLALMNDDDAIGILLIAAFVVALVVFVIVRLASDSGGCGMFITQYIIIALISIGMLYGSRYIFVKDVDDLHTPEIEQVYTVSQNVDGYDQDIILTITNCDETGKVTAKWETVYEINDSDRHQSCVALTGQIVRKRNNGEVYIEWEEYKEVLNMGTYTWLFEENAFIQYKDGTYRGDSVDMTVFDNASYEIGSIKDLSKLESTEEVYILTADIDFKDVENWTPISGFKGVLITNGHKIDNISLVAKESGGRGLFDTDANGFILGLE